MKSKKQKIPKLTRAARRIIAKAFGPLETWRSVRIGGQSPDFIVANLRRFGRDLPFAAMSFFYRPEFIHELHWEHRELELVKIPPHEFPTGKGYPTITPNMVEEYLLEKGITKLPIETPFALIDLVQPRGERLRAEVTPLKHSHFTNAVWITYIDLVREEDGRYGLIIGHGQISPPPGEGMDKTDQFSTPFPTLYCRR